MHLDRIFNRCSSFCIAACLLTAPLIMGAALAVDLDRIEDARHIARSTLKAAVTASLTPDGEIDTGQTREIYASKLELPPGQSSTPPVFYRDMAGSWKVGVRMVTRVTFGGILLPKEFHTIVTIRVPPASRNSD